MADNGENCGISSCIFWNTLKYKASVLRDIKAKKFTYLQWRHYVQSSKCLGFSCLAFSCPAILSAIFISCNFMPCNLVRQFHVRHFQRPRHTVHHHGLSRRYDGSHHHERWVLLCENSPILDWHIRPQVEHRKVPGSGGLVLHSCRFATRWSTRFSSKRCTALRHVVRQGCSVSCQAFQVSRCYFALFEGVLQTIFVTLVLSTRTSRAVVKLDTNVALLGLRQTTRRPSHPDRLRV